MSNRHKLETAIEREVHKLIEKISEHTYDFVNLYVRRNNIPVDNEQMNTILKLVKVAIQDGQLKQIDFFHEGIKKALDENLETKEVPFVGSQSTTKKEEKEEKFTFSVT